MRKSIILIYMVVMVSNINSQENTACFISNIMQGSDKCLNKYNKIVLDVLKNDQSSVYNSDRKFLIVHEFFATRKAAKLCENGEAQKDSLLSYINVKSSEFGEAYVFLDSNLLGVIHRSPVKINKFNFYKNDNKEPNNKIEIIKKIRTIKPDLVFTTYNLPRTYWLVKGDELIVISYEYKNSNIINLKTYNSDDYIQNVLKNEDIGFLTNKRVFVVSGK